MNDKGITNVIILIIALVLAVFLGSWVVSAPKEVGAGFVVVVAIVIFLVLKENFWILLPASFTLGISFPFIPGGFSLIELVSMYVVVGSFFLMLSHKISLRIRMTSLEWVTLALLMMLLQSYLRNPVGIRALGSDNIGGRPYVIMIIGLSAGWVLASTRTNYDQIRRVFKLSLLGYIGTFGLKLAAKLSFTIATYTSVLFGVSGGHADEGYDAKIRDSERADRNSVASLYARGASRILTAYINPLRALYKPFWLLLLLTTLMGAGMSGFRSVIGVTGMTIALSIYYWGKGRAVVVALFLALVAYVGVVAVQMAVPLPPNIQRSLSFLPGPWEERHITDAGASTDWRVEMWEEALYTDRYIRNKFLGDGLGIPRSDYMHMIAIGDSAVLTDEMSQERAMLAGDFHSGPVTTIKVIGYVGLLVLIMAMCIMSYRAHKLIIFAREKPFFREVMFFCLPMVTSPIIYLFIFGSFKTSIPIWFIQLGFLRLLENHFYQRHNDPTLAEESDHE